MSEAEALKLSVTQEKEKITPQNYFFTKRQQIFKELNEFLTFFFQITASLATTKLERMLTPRLSPT